MKKLEMLTLEGWMPVFCYTNGRPMVIAQADRAKALPSQAWHGAADLKYFSDKFGNNEFRLN